WHHLRPYGCAGSDVRVASIPSLAIYYLLPCALGHCNRSSDLVHTTLRVRRRPCPLHFRTAVSCAKPARSTSQPVNPTKTNNPRCEPDSPKCAPSTTAWTANPKTLTIATVAAPVDDCSSGVQSAAFEAARWLSMAIPARNATSMFAPNCRLSSSKTPVHGPGWKNSELV